MMYGINITIKGLDKGAEIIFTINFAIYGNNKTIYGENR